MPVPSAACNTVWRHSRTLLMQLQHHKTPHTYKASIQNIRTFEYKYFCVANLDMYVCISASNTCTHTYVCIYKPAINLLLSMYVHIHVQCIGKDFPSTICRPIFLQMLRCFYSFYIAGNTTATTTTKPQRLQINNSATIREKHGIPSCNKKII